MTGTDIAKIGVWIAYHRDFGDGFMPQNQHLYAIVLFQQVSRVVVRPVRLEWTSETATRQRI